MTEKDNNSKGKQGDNNSDQNDQDQKSEYDNFDAYLATLEKPIVELYETSVSGLKKALSSERDNRRKLSEQVKKLSPLADKGSEIETKLTETVKLLEEAEQRSVEAQRRANFAEQAIRPEVSCTNVRAAHALAVSEGAFNEDGTPQWDRLRELAPELFNTSIQTDAGRRTKTTPSDINSAIRRAAGIQ